MVEITEPKRNFGRGWNSFKRKLYHDLRRDHRYRCPAEKCPYVACQVVELPKPKPVKKPKPKRRRERYFSVAELRWFSLSPPKYTKSKRRGK